MKYRKLRIAWSVACGVMAMLLMVVWARSYWVYVFVRGPIANTDFVAQSMSGILYAAISPPGIYSRFESASKPASTPPFAPGHRFAYGHSSNQGRYAQMPHWCLAVLSFALASMPWLPHRFSLRTLLIVTTLIAVGLGVVVWMV